MPGKTVSPKMSTVFVFAVSSSRYNLGGVKSVWKTRFPYSLLSSFFFCFLGNFACDLWVKDMTEGGGQILNGFFTFRLIAPPTQPDRDSSGQLSTVIFGLLSFVCLNIKILFATNFHWAVCFSTPVTLGDHATPTK